MAHILTICTANICRSPISEALIREGLHKQGYTNWTVSSAGTWAEFERGAARYSKKIAAEHGYNLDKHISRMVEDAYLAEADLVVCKTSSHAESLRAEFPKHAHKIYLISEMVGKRYNVVDPYGGPYDGYVDMFFELRRIIDAGLPNIIQIANKNHALR